MKILVIGGGGREHAVVKKLLESPKVTQLFAAPGNGGIGRDAVCADIKAADIPAMVDFAVKKAIDFAVITPDDPLVLGMADAMREAGIRCFGPSKAAAQIEGSKIFSKALMKRYGIPTAAYESFGDITQAVKYADEAAYPLWIKADGLALGKGAIYAGDASIARAVLNRLMVDKTLGESGSRVVIEEHMSGSEVTVLAFTDGQTIRPMPSSMDHKRALDGNRGPNTGGMGAIVPNPFYTRETAERCMEEIFLPTIRAMKAEGRPFAGCLYFGMILTETGPKVIEYNCRFGDPETQALLPMLESDLLDIM
ncbi:MAG: phosphoribosylamine--glycine ligase, partial [Oscillospiraceae bacterium]|nr:phosphoribosylamine--glycine ligase [Oscillospiraceae bacterium]